MNNNSTTKTNVAIFGNVKMLVLSALLVALSIVLKLVAINVTENIRIGFENVPVIMAGIFFGPVIGGIVGFGADIIGSLLANYTINPIITIGAICVGVISGSVVRAIKTDKISLKVFPAVFIAHVIGSMIVKSIGLYLFFGTPVPQLLIRIPVYICNTIIEGTLVTLLMSNKEFNNMVKKFSGK